MSASIARPLINKTQKDHCMSTNPTGKKSASGAAESTTTSPQTLKPTIWAGTTDKTHMVSAAVASQLHNEHHWPPNDMTKVMGDDYRYDQFTLGNFLAAVQWNLAHGTPSYKFTYDGPFIK